MEPNYAMETRAVRALQTAWQAIYCDAFDVGGRQVNSLSRADVMDLVSSCGFTTGHPMTYGNDKEAVEWLEAQSQKMQDDLLKRAFPHRRYVR